jgi:DNA ligase-1
MSVQEYAKKEDYKDMCKGLEDARASLAKKQNDLNYAQSQLDAYVRQRNIDRARREMSTLKPMLACKDASKIRFPVYASPKLDGIRALVRDGVVLSRTLKPIPNQHVQRLFGRPELEGFDGELIVGAPYGDDVMQRTTSGVMRIEGEPDVTYYVFDLWDCPDVVFTDRYEVLRENRKIASVLLLTQEKILTQNQLDEYEAECIAEGYEGVMVRDPYGKYKYGRATAKEGYLTKIKRFEDSEAVVVGVEELMHNDNEATTDNLGHTKRSTHAAGKRPAGVLGALVCETPAGVRFNIGTGFSAEQRALLWDKPELIGKYAKYRHFAVTGVKDAPRFPVFLGFRHPEDM